MRLVKSPLMWSNQVKRGVSKKLQARALRPKDKKLETYNSTKPVNFVNPEGTVPDKFLLDKELPDQGILGVPERIFWAQWDPDLQFQRRKCLTVVYCFRVSFATDMFATSP
uniref:Uncharacterized protein n=1 Tax=Salix viminalis TaxID=40686 RepID=A0A6N2N8N9_SALVM